MKGWETPPSVEGEDTHVCVCVKRISMYTHSDVCFHCYREEKEEEHEGEED